MNQLNLFIELTRIKRPIGYMLLFWPCSWGLTIGFDFSKELTRNSNFPFYINLFNDYGLLWENKTKPTNSDNSLRASVGFGIKYYSPIGPVGLSWAFPLMDEEYDIKRMFLFSIGNID